MKDTLMDFRNWILDEYPNINIEWLKEKDIDRYIKSINEASSESQSVSDNEKEKKYFCERGLTWNNCPVWTDTHNSCDFSCKYYKQKYD